MSKKQNPLDLQTELFEEWEERQLFQEKTSNNAWGRFFDSSLLKKTRISLSYDTLLVIILMFIFVLITFFLLGIQYGKILQSRTIVTIEKTPSHLTSLGMTSTLQETTPSVSQKKSSVGLQPKARIHSSPSKVSSHQKVTSLKHNNPQKIHSQSPIHISHKTRSHRLYRYTIQIGASRDIEASEKDIQKIQKKGYNAFVVPYISSNGKQWYKLCIGRFKNIANARRLMKTFQKKERKKDCFITNL